MGSMDLNGGLLILVVVIILIIIICVVLFQQRFRTQEERDANMPMLITGIVVTIAVAVGIYLVIGYSCTIGKTHGSHSHRSRSHERHEYERVGQWWNKKKDERAMKKFSKGL